MYMMKYVVLIMVSYVLGVFKWKGTKGRRNNQTGWNSKVSLWHNVMMHRRTQYLAWLCACADVLAWKRWVRSRQLGVPSNWCGSACAHARISWLFHCKIQIFRNNEVSNQSLVHSVPLYYFSNLPRNIGKCIK